MELSVIIVNYNVKYFLEQCLYSLVKACSNFDAEIIVVDNHSTDGSKEYLSAKFPSVLFKWNTVNDGFAKANNSVLAEARGKYILFLNPDTILPEDCLETCISFLKEHSSCGALGVRMIDGSGAFLKESKRSFPSPMTSLFKMLGLARLFRTSVLFARYYAGHLPEHETNEVDVLAGAFFMSPKTVLQELKGFDESFFMYGEDVDLSYRIQNAGYTNFYLADTSIVHFKGESTQKNSQAYIRNFYGAMRLFVQKHYRDKKAGLFFMRMAINLSIVLARIKLSFIETVNSVQAATPATDVLIVANQERFNEILQTIKFASPPLLIKGRVACTDVGPDKPLGNLNALIGQYQVNTVLLCEGEMSFGNLIETMQRLSGKVNFLVNAEHSNSVVGSNSKNEKGIFIARP